MNLPDSDPTDLTTVTLGDVDIDSDVLSGGGGTLRDAIGGRPIDNQIGEIVELPQAGWRLIHGTPATGDWGGSETFAAPYTDTADSGWALASVSAPHDGGDWILSADPGPVRVFPGRPARRAALSLTWPGGPRATAASISILSIQLCNESDRLWSNERGDSAYVRGWLLNAAGRRLETSSFFVFGSGHGLPTLQPGEVAMLPVEMATFDYHSLPQGTYQLDAMLVELNLQAAAGASELS